MNTPRTLEIESRICFERVLNISAALGAAGIEHTVVENDYNEPLAIYVPGALDPVEAEKYAARVMRQLDQPPAPALDSDVTRSHMLREERMLREYAYASLQPPEPPKDDLPDGFERVHLHRLFPPLFASGSRSHVKYSEPVERLIQTVATGLSAGREDPLIPIGSLAEEQGGGDSFLHYDYPEIGDILPLLSPSMPNVHLTLKGSGVARVAPMRRKDWIMTLRDGIRQAQQAGMTEADINNNFTSEWIEKMADKRLPDSFKRGIAYLELAMEHASPFVKLNAGDAFIFDGSQQGDCLPQVHEFHTLRISDDPERNRRIFSVLRPTLINFRTYPDSW